MLRLLILALFLANGVYFAWSNGLMRGLGFAPAEQSEPQRLAQQIQPEALRIISAPEFKKVEEQVQSDLSPKECLQSGPFDEAQGAVLRKALEASMPAGSWQLDALLVPARWIVYMGKYPSVEALTKKRAELGTFNIKIEALSNPALEPGLSLGGFDTQAAATQELTRLNQRGIRTAHVVQERLESRVFQLKLPAVTEAFRPKLNEVKPALAGKLLKPCS
jgi:hypothetical protein